MHQRFSRRTIVKTLSAAIATSGLIVPKNSTLASVFKTHPRFQTRGIVLDVNDLSTVDWPRLAKDAGLNTIATHITPSQVAEFVQTDQGKKFLKECERLEIQIEHELHAIKDLLPRDLFKTKPHLFRQSSSGERTSDFNLCVHSEEALKIVASNAAKYAKLLPSTTGRYFFWIDDGAPMCQCDKCKQYSDSEQALIVENAIVEELRAKVDSQATLAHLAYLNTMTPPSKVKPVDGIFLEFAPIQRTWDKPLRDEKAKREDAKVTHGDYVRLLDENLKVFPVSTAQVLEYWLDVSLFSRWKKPAVELPWNKEVFLDDLDFYASRGIKHITSFGVYMDKDYFMKYPDTTFLKEYGQALTMAP